MKKRRLGKTDIEITPVGVGLASFLATVAAGYILEAHGYVGLFHSFAAVPLGGILILACFGGSLLPHRPARDG